MADISLTELAKHMKELDICMMTTQGKTTAFNSRPMSNNRDVTYEGDFYFFTYDNTGKIKDLEVNPNVCLNFEGKSELYISVIGKAKLTRNKASFAKHWQKSLQQWFPEGIDTAGMVLLHVKGSKIKYWQREKQGEIKLGKRA